MNRDAVLSDAQWQRISPLLPSSAGRRGRPFRDDHRVVEGIIWRYRVGTPWRDVPRSFGPWQTLWKRHRRYSGDGTWDRIHAELPNVGFRDHVWPKFLRENAEAVFGGAPHTS